MVKAIPRNHVYSTRKRKNFAPIKKYKDNRKPFTSFNFSTQSSPSPNNSIVKPQDQTMSITPFTQFSYPHFVFQQSQEIPTKNSIVKPTNSCSNQFMPYSISAHVSSLRRTVSEPPKFISDLSPEEYSIIKKRRIMKQEMDSSPAAVRNLMVQLPPLPPRPSPKLLRRTVSDSVSLSITKKMTDQNEKMEGKAVKAVKLSKNLISIKTKCRCGIDSHLIYCYTNDDCFKI
ncbi:unnamed protein product [Amaranthus hypochondriacus]